MAGLAPEARESVKSLLMTLHFMFPHEMILALDLLDRGLVSRMVIVEPVSSSSWSGSTATTGTGGVGGATVPAAGGAGSEDDDDDNAPGGDSYNTSTAPNGHEVFYIQSASSLQSSTTSHRHSRRYHGTNRSAAYEVRLGAWNCTCPAFAFSALGGQSFTLRDDDDLNEPHQPGLQHLREHSPSSYNDENEDDDPSHTAGADVEGNVEAEWMFGGTLTIPSSRSGFPPPVCKHILAAVLGKHVPGLFGSGCVQVRILNQEEAAGWAGGWGD